MIECRPYKYPKFPELEHTEIRRFCANVVALARSSVTLVSKIVALAPLKKRWRLAEISWRLWPCLASQNLFFESKKDLRRSFSRFMEIFLKGKYLRRKYTRDLMRSSEKAITCAASNVGFRDVFRELRRSRSFVQWRFRTELNQWIPRQRRQFDEGVVAPLKQNL